MARLITESGTGKMPWDDLFDYSLYSMNVVRRVVTRYRICGHELK